MLFRSQGCESGYVAGCIDGCTGNETFAEIKEAGDVPSSLLSFFKSDTIASKPCQLRNNCFGELFNKLTVLAQRPANFINHPREVPFRDAFAGCWPTLSKEVEPDFAALMQTLLEVKILPIRLLSVA